LNKKLRSVCLVLFAHLRLYLFGIFLHRSKLEAGKNSSAQGFPVVGEKEGSAVIQPDRQHNNRKNWQYQQQHHRSDRYVENPLYTVLEG